MVAVTRAADTRIDETVRSLEDLSRQRGKERRSRRECKRRTNLPGKEEGWKDEGASNTPHPRKICMLMRQHGQAFLRCDTHPDEVSIYS